MKKNISWPVLIIIGLVGDFIGRFTDGIIGDAVGVIGDICLLIGIVNAIVILIKRRKIKKENNIAKEEKKEKKESINYRNYIIYSAFAIIIILIIIIIFLISTYKNENEPILEQSKSMGIKSVSQGEKITSNSIIGFWLNESEDVSYCFEEDETLSVVKGERVSQCTYEISSQDFKKNSMDIWFYCPMPDWPAYRELHYVSFSKDYKSFTDAKNVQTMIDKIPGQFVKAEVKD